MICHYSSNSGKPKSIIDMAILSEALLQGTCRDYPLLWGSTIILIKLLETGNIKFYFYHKFVTVGDYITSFDTTTELMKAFKVTGSNMVAACNGKQSTFHGYVLRWENDHFYKYPISINIRNNNKYKLDEDIVRSLGKPRNVEVK